MSDKCESCIFDNICTLVGEDHYDCIFEPKRVKCEDGCVKKIIYNEFGDFEKAKYCPKCGTEIKHE